MTAAAQTVARGITLGLTVVTTAVVARALDVDQYATWTTVVSLVTLASILLDPALSPVLVRRLVTAPHTAPTAAAMRRVRLAVGVLAFLAVSAVAVALRGSGSAVLAIVLAAQLVPRSLVLNATAWLQVDQRLHRQTLMEGLSAAVGLVAVAVAAVLDAPGAVLALTALTGPAVLLAGLMRRELRRTPSSRLPSPGPQAGKVRSVLREVAPLAVALAIVAFSVRSHTIFVNAAEDSQGVAQFLFAFLFIEQVMVVGGILGNALLPLVANRARTTDLLSDEVTHRLTVAVAGLGGCVGVALLGLSGVLTRVIGGPRLAGAGHYVELLSPMAPVFMLSILVAYLYLSVGRSRRYLWINAIALALNLAAHTAFTLRYGAVAAARISWLTELVVVSLAFVPIARTGPSGASAAARNAVVVVALVIGAELSAAGLLPRGVGACLALVGVLAVTRSALLWCLHEVVPPGLARRARYRRRAA